MKMAQTDDAYARIDNPDECRSLLEQLCERGGAQLEGLAPDSPSVPVLLMEVVAGRRLILDLTTVPAVASHLEAGQAWRLA
ncbi:hypothetical protein V2S84_02245 [Azotobacter chroococcum]|nr:hypothetical protein [Azotobacter chroococcum]